MAWDFSTEPEFQTKLDWMDAFVRREVEPLDYLEPDLDIVYRPLDDRLKKIVEGVLIEDWHTGSQIIQGAARS